MKKLFVVLLSVVGCYLFAFGQDEEKRNLLTVGGGVGVAGYRGDLVGKSEESLLSNTKPYFNLSLERRFGKILGVELFYLKGQLSYNENNLDSNLHRNFLANFNQVGVNFIFNFDNDIIMKKQSPFSPYLSAGVHFFGFDSKTDLKDKDGNNYYYWNDGSIRTIDQNNENAPSIYTDSMKTKRDYVYETALSGSYSKSTISIPFTLGLKWKITERFQGRFYATYSLLMSDYIDNVSDDSKKDSYFNTGFSLHYVLRKKAPKDPMYEDVDVKRIDKGDKDKDGVKDINDECQGTRWDVKVDKKGCPIDTDKDGVPDYLDQEPNTEKGMAVDEVGRTITDALIQQRIEERNKIITERKTTFSEEEASTKTLDKIFDGIKKDHEEGKIGKSKIPERLQSVDTNKDGLISTSEMNAAFDGALDGSNNLTATDLNDLMEYFFEQ